jgi:hypothetical protein
MRSGDILAISNFGKAPSRLYIFKSVASRLNKARRLILLAKDADVDADADADAN